MSKNSPKLVTTLVGGTIALDISQRKVFYKLFGGKGYQTQNIFPQKKLSRGNKGPEITCFWSIKLRSPKLVQSQFLSEQNGGAVE